MSRSSEAVPNSTRVTGIMFGTEHHVRLSTTVRGARQQLIAVFRSETNTTGSIVRERGSMTSEAVTDRRVRRTRELLRSALLSLIMEKGYERLTVQDILEYLAGGMSEEDILRDFSELTRQDIQACLSFAADRERKLLVA